jgi:hypothetical protein
MKLRLENCVHGKVEIRMMINHHGPQWLGISTYFGRPGFSTFTAAFGGSYYEEDLEL